MVRQHGEQDVTRIIGERGIDRAEGGIRLIRFGVRGQDGVDHDVAASALA
jgi:hypothetical protein